MQQMRLRGFYYSDSVRKIVQLVLDHILGILRVLGSLYSFPPKDCHFLVTQRFIVKFLFYYFNIILV